jgi:ElaB/YqjD/DUF883 family membrane-anchored ribosome-binding protein
MLSVTASRRCVRSPEVGPPARAIVEESCHDVYARHERPEAGKERSVGMRATKKKASEQLTDEVQGHLDEFSRERLEELLEDASERAAGALADLRRDRIEPAVERLRENAPKYAERGREAFEQAREQAPEYAERAAERGRDAYEHAREVAPEYAERVAEFGREAWEHAPEYAERVGKVSRDAADRLEHYLEDHIDEETLHTWGPRAIAAFAGFAVGLLIGWLIGSRRDADEGVDEWTGLAHAPAEHAGGDARPTTQMPTIESAETADDGQQQEETV